MFAQQSLADGDAVKFADIGADRQPVDRRRADDRQITHTGQRQLQRARNRRGRQGQHMHIAAQLLQALLVGDAEMLFLVDHEQAEVLKRRPLAKTAWVPTTISTVPLASPSRVSPASLLVTNRDSGRTVIGRPRKRSSKLL